LILWVFSVKAGTAMFLFVYIPLTFFSSSYVTHKLLRNNIVPDVTARAGIFAKQYLPRADIIKTLIIVPEGYSFFKPLYHMDNPKDSSYLLLKKGMTYDMSKISGDKEWLLVIGENMFANNNLFQVPMNGFTLMRTNNRQEIDFKKPFWPGTITKTQGLGGVEPWGAWSAGDVLTIEFLQSLPRKFKVILSAYAYGENVGKEFIAHVGDSSIKFTIQSTPGKSPDIVSLEFENPNQSNILRIDMPSLGEIENKLMSNNQRLSLGLVFLSVEEI
jgi:phosphoglycerol transferase